MTTAEQRIVELELVLPDPPKPKGVYKPYILWGDQLWVSGHGPLVDADGNQLKGKVGDKFTTKQATAAARDVGLGILSTVRLALGSLDRVVQIIRTKGMVNGTPDFGDHILVINGYSELMRDVFGEVIGIGARSAVGMGTLPNQIPVEIEVVLGVKVD